MATNEIHVKVHDLESSECSLLSAESVGYRRYSRVLPDLKLSSDDIGDFYKEYKGNIQWISNSSLII